MSPWCSDSIGVACLCTLLAIGYFLLIRRKNTNLPPGPAGLPLVGSLFQLGSIPHESLSRLSTRYGSLMTVRLGLQTTVVVSSAEMAEQVLLRHDKAFAGRAVSDTLNVLDHPKLGIILNQNVPRWRSMRRICNTHLFTPRQLDSMSGLRQRKVGALLEHVRARCERGEAVDVGECVFSTVLNLLSNTVFSRDVVADLESEGGSEFKSLVWGISENAGKPNVADFFPALRWVDPQGLRRRMKMLVTRFRACFDEMVDRRLASRNRTEEIKMPAVQTEIDAGDFLDVLIELSEDSRSGFARESIKPLLSDLFAAGVETATSTVEWAMAELLRHPEKMAKAKTELSSVVGDRCPVEESDIPHLPYLQAIVKETLRLHPPVPLLIPHRADVTTEIGGFTIPKYTQVLINVWAISRDAAYWDAEPTFFMPDRFVGNYSDVHFKGKDFQFIPFGAGRRMCPGLPLADRMVHLLLASLTHSFSWKLPDGMEPEQLDMRSKFGTALQRATPLKAVPFDPSMQ